MSTIKVGNTVTWQGRKTATITPLAITGCKVIKVGTDVCGITAVLLDCGSQIGKVAVYATDLVLEDDE